MTTITTEVPLLERCGAVCVPESVRQEVDKDPAHDIEWPSWVRVVLLEAADRAHAERWRAIGEMHAGEADAFVCLEAEQAVREMSRSAGS